jgi:uncharacterized protein (TIGR03435 family)
MPRRAVHVFEAWQQLGLGLNTRQEPVEVVVIDQYTLQTVGTENVAHAKTP